MSFTPVAAPAVTIDLEKPIQFLGEAITKLALREPNGGDIFRCGNPVISFDVESGAYEFDEKKAFAMISRLSGIPFEGSLEFMGSDDAVAAFEGLGPFFVRGLRKVMAATRRRGSRRRPRVSLDETARAARRLAKHYGRSPLEFLDLPTEQVWRLWDDTVSDLAEERLAAFHNEG